MTVPGRRSTASGRARIAVVGAGWWCTAVHLPNLRRRDDVEIVGIADLNLEKAEQAACRFEVPYACDDHRKLLARGPNGVVIATPPDTHYAVARDFLEAGVDVLVEKPMVVEPKDGEELVALARSRGSALHVGYWFPYTRHALKLKEIVQEGRLGEIQLVTGLWGSSTSSFYKADYAVGTQVRPNAMWGPEDGTYNDPDRGGGQALSQVTHCASLLFFVTGLVPRRVHAFMQDGGTPVDVVDAISFEATNGALGSISSTGFVPRVHGRIEEYRIFGSKGQALLNTGAGTLEILFEDGTRQVEKPLPQEERYPHDKPIDSLVNCILGRETVLVSGELGLLTARFLDAARRSAADGIVQTL